MFELLAIYALMIMCCVFAAYELHKEQTVSVRTPDSSEEVEIW